MTKTSRPAQFSVHLTPRRTRALGSRLLAWYDSDRRDLPWRRTLDPYAILVSEFMLQQTQVAAVVPYFERFMAAFPTVKALAAASEQDVLRLWAGLGYYSRARHLRATAGKIVEEYGGRIPPRVADLLFLPGVGGYVAGAVASIAFGVAAPAVDANVARVLSRAFALSGNPAIPRVRRELESLAAALIPSERPGDFNQAMMELGARVCNAAKPLCPECPLNGLCKAATEGNPLDYPAPAKRPETVEVEEAVAVVRRDEPGDEPRYLITQRPGDSGRYRNMWEFPHVVVGEGENPSRKAGKDTPKPALQRVRGPARQNGSKPALQTGRAVEMLTAFLSAELGLQVRIEEEWAEIRHQVTHHKIRKRVFLVHLVHHLHSVHRVRPKPNTETDDPTSSWATLEEIAELPLGAPHKRILTLLAESAGLFSL